MTPPAPAVAIHRAGAFGHRPGAAPCGWAPSFPAQAAACLWPVGDGDVFGICAAPRGWRCGMETCRVQLLGAVGSSLWPFSPIPAIRGLGLGVPALCMLESPEMGWWGDAGAAHNGWHRRPTTVLLVCRDLFWLLSLLRVCTSPDSSFPWAEAGCCRLVPVSRVPSLQGGILDPSGAQKSPCCSWCYPEGRRASLARCWGFCTNRGQRGFFYF